MMICSEIIHCEKSLFVLDSRQKIPVLRKENPAVDTRTICLPPIEFFTIPHARQVTARKSRPVTAATTGKSHYFTFPHARKVTSGKSWQVTTDTAGKSRQVTEDTAGKSKLVTTDLAGKSQPVPTDTGHGDHLYKEVLARW
jgi:hypothetical protein